MSRSRIRRAAAVLALAGWGVLIPVGVAGADCTTAGDFGAGAGCPPSDSSGSGNKTESWPPTAVDWPPQLGDDNNSEGGGKNGGNGGGGDKTTPIVMPNGQKPSATPSPGSDSTNTSTSETPIVPVGPASAGKTSTSSGSTSTTTSSTPIVTPGG